MALWTPDYLAVKPVTWFDAQDAATITKNGSNEVSDWANKGTAGGTVSQATTAAKPIYVAASNIAALPAMRCDGARRLAGTVALGAMNQVGMTNTTCVSWKVQLDAVDRDSTNSVGFDLSADTMASAIWSTADVKFYEDAALAKTIASLSISQAGWFFIVADHVDGGGGGGFGRWVFTDALFNNAALNRGTNGDVGEIICGIGTLTAAEQALIEGYAAWRWSGQGRLAGGHAYAAAAPVVHVVAAVAFAAGSPVIGTPALTQIHGVTAVDLAAASPAIVAPAVTQIQLVTAVAVAPGSPAFGTVTLTQAHQLSATAVATGSPVIEAPAASQSGDLVAVAVAPGSPAYGSIVLTQAHQLTCTAVAPASPAYGTMTLTQAHQLTAVAFAAGSPVITAPAGSQSHSLTCISFTAGSPVFGGLALSQVHSVVATAFAPASPVYGPLLLSQAHQLVAAALLVSPPVITAPVLTLGYIPGATDRTIYLVGVSRTIVLAPVSRTVVLFQGSLAMRAFPAKHPSAKDSYQLDWTRRLDAGDDIVNSAWVVQSGDVVLSAPARSTTMTETWIEGGTANTTSILVNTVTTISGRTPSVVVSIDIVEEPVA